MTCAGWRGRLLEMARGANLHGANPRDAAEVHRHCAECRECRGFLKSQLRLTAAAAALSAEAAQFAPSPAIEDALLAEFMRVRRPSKSWWAAAAAAGIAAALLAGWAVQHRVHTPLSAVRRPIAAPPVAAPAALEQAAPPKSAIRRKARKKPRPAAPLPPAYDPAPEPESPFIAIPFTAPLAPYERADVLRVDVPVSALIAAGLPLEVSDPAAHVRADLVVSEDGRTRAVRLISISDRSYQ